MRLKTSIILTSAALTLLAGTSAIAAPSSANSNFNISVNLEQPITLTKVRDLSFQNEGTGANSYSILPTDPTSADFSATGEAGQTAHLSFANATADITCSAGACMTGGGVQTININNFTCSSATCDYTFDPAGTITDMTIGATNTVVAGNQAGTYTGAQTITLAYI